MTKSRSGKVTKGIIHLLTDASPVLVIIRMHFLLLLGRYLLPLTTLNIYQSIDTSGKVFFTTSSRYVATVRYRMSLVAILVLDFGLWIIQWMRWIHRKSFSKNSIRVFCKSLETYHTWQADDQARKKRRIANVMTDRI